MYKTVELKKLFRQIKDSNKKTKFILKLCRKKESKIIWIFIVLVILYLNILVESTNGVLKNDMEVTTEGELTHLNTQFIDNNSPDVSHINSHGFSNLPLVCNGDDESPKLLIIISSKPANFEARKAIRYAWGDIGLYDQVQFAFLMGSSKSAQESKIADEILRYDDIIRGKFIDNDENLTVKTISMLEWVSSDCPNAKFILKIDDQTFVNVEKLLKIIYGKLQDTKSIYGRVSRSSDLDERKKFKFFGKSIPEFLIGPVYMMTGDSVKLIYEAALSAKHSSPEDVFITGILANQVGLKRFNMEEVKSSIPESITKCDLKDIVSISGVSADQHYDLWFTLNDQLDFCDLIE